MELQQTKQAPQAAFGPIVRTPRGDCPADQRNHLIGAGTSRLSAPTSNRMIGACAACQCA